MFAIVLSKSKKEASREAKKMELFFFLAARSVSERRMNGEMYLP